MSQIAAALTRLFARHRIVVWTDEKRELRAEFDALDLGDVVKIALAGDEFGVKHRILRGEPATSCLLYREGPPPLDTENGLLGVELAEYEAVLLELARKQVQIDLDDGVKVNYARFGSALRRVVGLNA